MNVLCLLLDRTLITIDKKRGEKRPNESSEEEGSGNEEEMEASLSLSKKYHSIISSYIQRLFEIGNSYLRSFITWLLFLDDTAFIKEITACVVAIDGDLLTKEERTKFNNELINFHNNLDNQGVKRQLKSKNKALCTIDPSLTKL